MSVPEKTRGGSPPGDNLAETTPAARRLLAPAGRPRSPSTSAANSPPWCSTERPMKPCNARRGPLPKVDRASKSIVATILAALQSRARAA